MTKRMVQSRPNVSGGDGGLDVGVDGSGDGVNAVNARQGLCGSTSNSDDAVGDTATELVSPRRTRLPSLKSSAFLTMVCEGRLM